MASLHRVDAHTLAIPATDLLDELAEAVKAKGDTETAEALRKAYHNTWDLEFTIREDEAIVRDFQVEPPGTILHLTGEERIALSRAVSMYLVDVRARKLEHAIKGAERLFVRMEEHGLVGAGAVFACPRR